MSGVIIFLFVSNGSFMLFDFFNNVFMGFMVDIFFIVCKSLVFFYLVGNLFNGFIFLFVSLCI